MSKQRKQAMLEALERSLGIVSAAAANAGISRETHYRWLREDEDYAEKVESLKNVALDFAEDRLFRLMRAENPTAIIFYLKTQGKQRGYYEHRTQDMTTDGQPITINFIPAEDD